MLINTLIIIPGILIGLSFHEFAHAAVAYAMGDDTAKLQGRMTVDPLRHIDPIGFLMLILMRFGWAKPVPINEANFKHRGIGLFLVSIAGIVMNLLLAIIFFIILHFTQDKITVPAYSQVMNGIIFINIGLASFNLLPFPPLDGSKIIYSFLPTGWRYYFYQYEKYAYFVLLFLLISGIIGRFLNPIYNTVIALLNSILGAIL